MPLTERTRGLLLPAGPARAPVADPFDVSVADLVVPIQDGERHDALLLGVPFDGTTLGRAGSRHAPPAIRAALTGLLGHHAGLDADMAPTARIGDAGDVDVLHTDLQGTWTRISEVIQDLAGAGAPLVVIGGDHGLTFPVLRGLAAARPGGLATINLDAHYDLRPSYHGEPASGVPFRYALERLGGAVQALSCTHIGMAGWANSRAAAEYARRSGLRVVTAAQVRSGDPEAIAAEALARAEPAAAGAWISLDIDVVDGAFAPGTGSPTVDGLTSHELLRLVWLLGRSPRVLGMDVVEVAPAFDPTGITVKLAASAIVTFLAARWLAAAGTGGADERG